VKGEGSSSNIDGLALEELTAGRNIPIEIAAIQFAICKWRRCARRSSE
jgi:hypothetical protein